MDWLSANWLWLIVIGGMLWMHLGMHRGHGGGHGGHGGHDGDHHRTDPSRESHDHEGSTATEGDGTAKGGGHRHGGC